MNIPASWLAAPRRFMPLGNASVEVHYVVEDGVCSLLCAIVNGMAVDCEDCFSDSVLDGWRAVIEDDARASEEERLMDVARAQGVSYSALQWTRRAA